MLMYVDWGSSRRRAFLLSHDEVLDQRDDEGGVKFVPAAACAASLEAFIGDWLNREPQSKLLISGMVTSREGWFPSPSQKTPFDLKNLHRHLIKKSTESIFGDVWLVPGLQGTTEDGAPEFMRGEETQIYLELERMGCSGAWFVLPGTHSKWVLVEEGRILHFKTFLTGELFGLLVNKSLLKTGGQTDSYDGDAFGRGVEEAIAFMGGPGGLLHLLFRGRARMLAGQLPAESLTSWVSGLLLGSEVREGLSSIPKDENVPLFLLGEGMLMDRYRQVFGTLGRTASCFAPSGSVPQILHLAERAGLIEGESP